MSSSAISGSSSSSFMEDWITPEAQLYRLAWYVAEKEVEANQTKFLMAPDQVKDSIINSAAKSILERSQLLDPKDEVPRLFDQCIDQLIELNPLPSALTNWYVARKKLGNLPEKIPPLPSNIFEIFNSKCPIYDNQTKSDGTYRSVGETHVLQLLCQEDGNLNQFEKILKSYSEKNCEENACPPRFNFWPGIREACGNVQFGPTHWDLLTRTILPGSRNQSYNTQVGLIDALSRKALVHYAIPSLETTPRTVFLHKVATGEDLYPNFGGDEQRPFRATYTRLEGKTQGERLQLGIFLSSRHCYGGFIDIDTIYEDLDDMGTGMGARRCFKRLAKRGWED